MKNNNIKIGSEYAVRFRPRGGRVYCVTVMKKRRFIGLFDQVLCKWETRGIKRITIHCGRMFSFRIICLRDVIINL